MKSLHSGIPSQAVPTDWEFLDKLYARDRHGHVIQGFDLEVYLTSGCRKRELATSQQLTNRMDIQLWTHTSQEDRSIHNPVSCHFERCFLWILKSAMYCNLPLENVTIYIPDISGYGASLDNFGPFLFFSVVICSLNFGLRVGTYVYGRVSHVIWNNITYWYIVYREWSSIVLTSLFW